MKAVGVSQVNAAPTACGLAARAGGVVVLGGPTGVVAVVVWGTDCNVGAVEVEPVEGVVVVVVEPEGEGATVVVVVVPPGTVVLVVRLDAGGPDAAAMLLTPAPVMKTPTVTTFMAKEGRNGDRRRRRWRPRISATRSHASV
jgi:hypothetical protein